jgi:hypothetical protein
VAANGNGHGVIAWKASYARIGVALFHHRQMIGRPQIITPRGHYAGAVTVGIDAQGAPIVVWEDEKPNTSRLRVELGDPAGHFHHAGQIWVPRTSSLEPWLVTSPDGTSILTWTASVGVGHRPAWPRVHVAVRPAGSARFRPQHPLSAPHHYPGLRVESTITANDKAVVVWDETPCDLCDQPATLHAAVYKPAP